jgi:hypothetical protein
MIIERRMLMRVAGEKPQLGAVLISESEKESTLIDELFGCKVVHPDGLIARRTVEVRLADGFREHYIFVVPEEAAPG